MYIWKYVYNMHVNIAVELQQAWWNPRTSRGFSTDGVAQKMMALPNE